jgi:hypothetical protein
VREAAEGIGGSRSLQEQQQQQQQRQQQQQSLPPDHDGEPTQPPENAASENEDSGWLCEAIIALAGMLSTTWAIAYLWWHFGQLLEDDGVDSGDTKFLANDGEPWYFAWVSSDQVPIC